MGHGTYGQWGTGGMGYRGMSNRVLGVWGQSAMGYKGYGSHGQWDTWGMGHMGNEVHWAIDQ